MANDAPILLLQWLEPGEHKETKAAMAKFGGNVKIAVASGVTTAHHWGHGSRTLAGISSRH
jgi:hypothetical protein